MNKKIAVIGLLLLLALVASVVVVTRRAPSPIVPVIPVVSPSPSATPTLAPTLAPALPRVVKTPALPRTQATPAPVKIHTELIPKNIEIVRVYYGEGYSIAGPDSTMEFDINGSGFTEEFEKMIAVNAGGEGIQITSLRLVTPNQIHGRMKIGPDVATALYYPQVLIQNKVVFQATDPYAVIRLGEVLTMIFTEMSESGRSGRFRIFTHLSRPQFESLMIEPSTSSIQIADIEPKLPFVVEGTLNVGSAAGGTYGIALRVDGKVVWSREDIIRVVRPNVGQAGLAQSLKAQDGYHRPGDRALFVLQGSGFLPDDVAHMRVRVTDMANVVSSFTYISPGRMLISIDVPRQTPVGKYGVEVFQSTETIIKAGDAFQVVDKNWLRGIKTEPALAPGGTGQLVLEGRDLDESFIQGIQVETDVGSLRVGPFKRESAERAVAEIKAGSDLKAGDYWLKLSRDGRSLNPQTGSIIRIANPT